MKLIIVLSLASSSLAVPFGSLLDAMFVRRGIPAPENMEEYPQYGTGRPHKPLPTGTETHHTQHTRRTRTATGTFPTASGGYMSIQPHPWPESSQSVTLSIGYGLPPQSTPVEVPEESEAPTPTPAVPVVTPPAAPSVYPPVVNPGIPTPGSPGLPTPGQPGVPVCGQPGLEACGQSTLPGAPIPSATVTPSPEDSWSSYASPDITPGVPAPSGGYSAYPTGVYPTGGYTGTGAYGPPSTFTTYSRSAQPTPVEQSDDEDDEEDGEEGGYGRRSLWRRVKESIEDALEYGGSKSEMST